MLSISAVDGASNADSSSHCRDYFDPVVGTEVLTNTLNIWYSPQCLDRSSLRFLTGHFRGVWRVGEELVRQLSQSWGFS